MPENLKKGQVSVTYGVLKDIFSIIEDSNRSERLLSLSNIPDCLTYCVVGMLVIWLKNLVVFSVKSRFIRNDPACVNHLVPEFIA